MIHLSAEFCANVRHARRQAGLTQSALAREVGCKQSALSMFELGDGTKLNDEAVGRLAKRFGLKLPTNTQHPTHNTLSPRASLTPPYLGFCPNPHCPTNHRYEVEDAVLFLPDRASADPVGGAYCAMCGELLERRCANCGAPVHDGAICSLCGERYVVG